MYVMKESEIIPIQVVFDRLLEGCNAESNKDTD